MRILATLTASVLFSLASLAIVFGVADLADNSARGWMTSWETQRRVSDVAQWNQAHSRLLMAHRLNPLNADYSANLGHLMEWRSWHESPDSLGFTQARADAEVFYLEAVGRRPSWGYAWANFAETRLLQGKSDEKFLRAMEMAISLAPWEPVVQRKIAWMGMATWGDLPDSTRELVRESILRIVELEDYSSQIVRLAVHYDWLEHLKPMLRTKRQRAALAFVLQQLEAQW
jgi:hypothetical protein